VLQLLLVLLVLLVARGAPAPPLTSSRTPGEASAYGAERKGRIGVVALAVGAGAGVVAVSTVAVSAVAVSAP
jgi:hypothetical protein